MNKKPIYYYLPKKQKNVIDLVTKKDMYRLLDGQQHELFCWIVGVIANLKMETGKISEDHQGILEIPSALFERVVGDEGKA